MNIMGNVVSSFKYGDGKECCITVEKINLQKTLERQYYDKQLRREQIKLNNLIPKLKGKYIDCRI